MAFAWYSHKKSLIIVVVTNHKARSAYHCIVDHVVLLLISMCLNLIGSVTTTTSQSAMSHPKNDEWIGFALSCLNSFSITFIILFLLVFCFELSRSRPKRYDFIVIIYVDLNCLWIVLYDNDDIWYEMILMTSRGDILVYIYIYMMMYMMISLYFYGDGIYVATGPYRRTCVEAA